MFQRILVLLENPSFDSYLCQTALELAQESGARLKWVHLMPAHKSADLTPLLLLHQQGLLLYRVESDMTQVADQSLAVVQEELIKWHPDLILAGPKHLQALTPVLANHQAHRYGQTCSTMLVADPEEIDEPAAQLPSEIPTLALC